MSSTFTGIEIGKRSIQTHTAGLNTIGHNISNASTEGYSRQRLEMRASDAIYLPGLSRAERAGQLGQGVDVTRIERVSDRLLEGRIVGEQNLAGYWSQRDKYLLMVDQVYSEPSEFSVRALMDSFWESWQELSLRPSEVAPRKAVIERGNALLDAIHNRFQRLSSIRDMINDDVVGTLRQVRDISSEIAQLNSKIVKIEAMGDRPNDLYDHRDLLVRRLSDLVDIEVSTRDADEFVIHSGGSHLVQGGHYEALEWEPDPENEGYARILWPDGRQARFQGGKMAGLIELRDLDLRQEIQSLDMVSINFIDLVNEVHRGAYGMGNTTGEDFFVEYPFINNLSGNYDQSGDGEYDSTYVFRITGSNALVPKEQIGLRGALSFDGGAGPVTVEYFPTDTVEDLIQRINLSGAEVVARLNQEGRLTLKGVPASDTADPDFVLRHVEDSSQFLVGYAGILADSGPDGAFDWGGADAVLGLRGGVEYAVAPLSHPSGWITINPLLSENPEHVAGASESNGRSAGPGDGSAALAIARLRTEPVMIGRISTFDDFFAQSAVNIGLKGETAERSMESITLVMKELQSMREALSGVNMDEELANMIKFQHGYSAAARFISEMDQMIDTIINRMGV